MSTRSIIARENANGTVDAIYCHFDGYIDHHGPILLEHYTDPAKVDALIALGDISVLAEEIGEKHDYNLRGHAKWVKAYGRDREEEGTQAKVYVTADALFNRDAMRNYGAGRGYLFRGGTWFYAETDYEAGTVSVSPLAEALAVALAAEES